VATHYLRLAHPGSLGAMMQKIALCAAILFCALAALTLADKPYLTATEVDFSSVLPPPPADGSLAHLGEIQVVLEMQRNLSADRLARIQADTTMSIYRLVGGIFGLHFTKDRFPLTDLFFEKVTKATTVGIAPVKVKYGRLRPFQVSSAVKTPADIAAGALSPAYPSGHSAFGAEVALLLASMVPEKEAELFARGWEYGKQRIASGVAYPSDWEAGQVSAAAMVQFLSNKPEFRADFDATRSELRKGLGLP
jgi:acid phosphatase (class A)